MGINKFTIRKATIDDCDIILHLIALLAEYEKEPEAAIATKEDLLQYGFTDNPLFYCILAETEGNVVGFALYFLIKHFPTYSIFHCNKRIGKYIGR